MATAQDLLKTHRQKANVHPDVDAFVRSARFPCAGAKSALRLGQVQVVEAGAFSRPDDNDTLYRALGAFGQTLDIQALPFRTLIAAFDREPARTEAGFEQLLWAHLQALHDRDARRGIGWSDSVSTNPESADFNICVGGTAYFVIGLHPGASRAARRFCRPALVFNSHDQFEALRADGRYQALQKVTRDRELVANGSINPMLGDHAQRAQAPQYSGRQVGEDWKCPFTYRTPKQG